jgi:protein O-mannosyl-transferase
MPGATTTHARFRVAIACVLLFVVTALLFSRSTRSGFVNYDDPDYVTENAHVQAGLSWDGVVWAFTAPNDYWHPLTWLSHMLDWQLFGPAPLGHHVTSVLWHALNAALAFLVFRRLTGGFWSAAFAAALFAWHPLRVESVVWVTERKDVMSGCFFLLTLFAYAGYVERRANGGRWWGAWSLTLACFVGGLMSKPMLVTLPVVLLLLDFWPFARLHTVAGVRLALLEKVPFFVLSSVTAIVTVLMQRHDGAFVLDLSFAARAANAVVSLARYLGKFFWPSDLIVCYAHPGSWPALAVIAASALALGLSALAWHQRRNCPWIAAGWLWFLVVLLPVIGVIQVGFQSMADRYTYLALLGIELALVPTITSWRAMATPRVRAVAALAAVVFLAGCAARTWKQQGVWRDSVSLFEHAVAASDRNDIAEDFLSSALLAAGRFDEAAAHAERALAINPRNSNALTTLAAIRELQGRTFDARDLYRKTLELRPDDALVRAQLSQLELREGRNDEARELLTTALRSRPALRARVLELGLAALQQRNLAAARFHFENLLAVWPDDADAHAGMGGVLLAENKPDGAIVHLRAATERRPALADAQLALARCAEQLGRPEEAAAALSRALAAAPDDAAIQSGAAELHARRRDYATAARHYRRAAELAPKDAGIHAALGYMLILTGDRAAGLAEWRRALELDPDLPGLRERLMKASQQP